MNRTAQTLETLERKFWQSMVDQETDVALGLLDEPALMVSAHGSMKFDHAGYRKMAEQGSMVLKDFDLQDMQVVFPVEDTAILMYRVKQTMSPRDKEEATTREMVDSSTWVRKDGEWKCVMHTETPATSGK